VRVRARSCGTRGRARARVRTLAPGAAGAQNHVGKPIEIRAAMFRAPARRDPEPLA
jgi:hypothetical protein